MVRTDEPVLTVAAAGDAMVTKRLSNIDNPRFEALRQVLRTADAAVVNLESPLHDFEMYPMARKRTHFRSPPWVADELAWMGFNLYATPNNHIGDYAQQGMMRTLAELDKRELAHAGMGETRSKAYLPTYIETPAGRVALLAVTSTFVPGTHAAHQRGDVGGRPGIATLRLRPRYQVTSDHLEAIRELHDALQIDTLMADRGGYVRTPADEAVVPFLDVGGGTAGRTLMFEEGTENTVVYEPEASDRNEIHSAIKLANRNADIVLFSLHGHEGADGTYNDESIPPYLESFARDCVDRGVDLFFCHGPHRIRGMELYDGAPIFYSLGNFILQYNTVPVFPAEGYESRGLDPNGSPIEIQSEIGDVIAKSEERQAILPVCTFEDGRLVNVTCHPVELGRNRTETTQGVAYLAESTDATDVLERLAALSEPYGTELAISDEVGTVRLPSES